MQPNEAKALVLGSYFLHVVQESEGGDHLYPLPDHPAPVVVHYAVLADVMVWEFTM